MDNDKIRIAIIEDNTDFREGLAFFINSTSAYTCVGTFGSVEIALKNFKECDILLLDINLPGTSGVEAISLIKAISDKIKIIMLTVFEDDNNIFNSLAAGADGYLLKKTHPLKILSALEDVLSGGSAMSPFVARRVLEHFKANSSISADYQLSTREKEILKYLVEGVETKVIANTLFISYDTVRNHIKNIYSKLNVSSKSQAVAKAIKERIIK